MGVDEGAVRRLVLTEIAKQGDRFVPVGVSARHVHLTQHDLEALFGAGYQLTPIKPISQPGQFASQEQVAIIGPKGRIDKVRVLGPVRPETQIEISVSDSFVLGAKNCPIRLSGDLDGTPGVTIEGPKGSITISKGLIVAARHLHMNDEQAKAYGIHDGQVVSLRVGGARPCTMEGVICRTGAKHELEVHIDTDEANACGLKTGDLMELVQERPQERSHECKGTCLTGECTCGNQSPKKAEPEEAQIPEDEILDLVTERDLNEAFRDNKTAVYCEKKALITPAAADRSNETGIKIIRIGGKE
ncbi:MAG: phosphate propanoyltransferase [Lachnospiraceae bacterium]|nr:phosphate propanoyltransferase [Lachnospiraceae bacterium]